MQRDWLTPRVRGWGGVGWGGGVATGITVDVPGLQVGWVCSPLCGPTEVGVKQGFLPRVTREN